MTADTAGGLLQSIRASENAATEDDEDLAALEVSVFTIRAAERLMRATNATAMSIPRRAFPPPNHYVKRANTRAGYHRRRLRLSLIDSLATEFKVGEIESSALHNPASL